MLPRYIPEFGQDIANSIRELAVPVVGSTIAITLGGWSIGKGLVQSFIFSIEVWIFMFCAAIILRVAYWPIQYLRHKLAVRRVERRERKLKRQGEIVFVSDDDPRFYDWWRW